MQPANTSVLSDYLLDYTSSNNSYVQPVYGEIFSSPDGSNIPGIIVIPTGNSNTYPAQIENTSVIGKNVSVLDLNMFVVDSNQSTIQISDYWMIDYGVSALTPKLSKYNIKTSKYYLSDTTYFTINQAGDIVVKDPNFNDVRLVDIVSSGTTLTAGDGISLVGNIITNTKPDQTVTITGVNLDITGTYPNFTITNNGLVTLVGENAITVTGNTISSPFITITDEDYAANTYISELEVTDHAINVIRATFSGNYALSYGIDGYTPISLPNGAVIGLKAGNNVTLTQTDTTIQIDAIGGGDSIFTTPDGFTATTHTAGAITAGTAASGLNGLLVSKVLQNILFKDTTATFVIPTLTVIPSLTNAYVELGSTSTITLTASFASTNYSYSVNSSGVSNVPQAYALGGDYVYNRDGSTFTNGSTITFTANTTFTVSVDYEANNLCNQKLSTGTIVNASGFTGYPSSRVLTYTKAYTAVNPIYYGCISNTQSSVFVSGFNDSATWTKIKATTKNVGATPAYVSLTVSSYTGSVDPLKWIIIAIPSSITVSSIKYVQFSNTEVLTTFSTIGDAVYTRPDSVTTTYKLYYVNNRYNANESVTYNVYF